MLGPVVAQRRVASVRVERALNIVDLFGKNHVDTRSILLESSTDLLSRLELIKKGMKEKDGMVKLKS